jgi:drug/metabolite transporter (DMT)-like permease
MKAAVAWTLVAAALFGASAPAAKLLLAATSPLLLAGLLYLGAGLAALLIGGLAPRTGEARLTRADAPWLAGAIVIGGVVGPLLLMVGLERTSATAASLLLNLEVVFTTLLAALLFHEAIGRRGVVALVLIVTGAAILTFDRSAGHATTVWGPLAVAGACAAWGLDNNLTQKLSARDPLAVVRWKGLCAGAFSLAVGLLAHGRLPPARAILGGLAVGALGYGLSLALVVRAMRELGAARTGMVFATAPFAGAVLSIPLLHERPTAALAAAAGVLALGVLFIARERHEHPHTHDAIAHEHRHVHDAHHQHAHDHDYGPEPHVHPHTHEPVTHRHPHAPDLHHRHRHKH